MRYVKTFMQEGKRYSEEISEEQHKFYTSKHYVPGDSSHKIIEIVEDPKPELAEDEFLVPELIVDENGAKESYRVEKKPVAPVNTEPEMVNVQLSKEDADILMQLLAERKGG